MQFTSATLAVMALFAGQTLAQQPVCRIIPNTRQDTPVECNPSYPDSPDDTWSCGPFGAVVANILNGKLLLNAGPYPVTFSVGCRGSPPTIVKCDAKARNVVNVDCASFDVKYYVAVQ
ncbi:hypothetical protein E4U53_006026 [Claviceps sorghi]|nr:hypothetical protein E4U53_006026 [Claviceps sorghi]